MSLVDFNFFEDTFDEIFVRFILLLVQSHDPFHLIMDRRQRVLNFIKIRHHVLQGFHEPDRVQAACR